MNGQLSLTTSHTVWRTIDDSKHTNGEPDRGLWRFHYATCRRSELGFYEEFVMLKLNIVDAYKCFGV